MTKQKKTYNVTLYFHTNVSINVQAESEREAIDLAQAESARECYIKELLDGLQEDSAPDAVEVED
jgi:hypothetical protein